MSRIVAVIALFAFGCAAAPAPAPAAPSSGGTPASDPPGASASDPGDDPAPKESPLADECPAATEPCMNEDNHADCMAVAASCGGHVVQLESCPLQFACAKP